MFAVIQISNVESNARHIVTNNLPAVEAAGQIRSLVNNIRRLEARHLMAKDDREKDAREADMAQVS